MPVGPRAVAWIGKYRALQPEYELAAQLARSQVKEALRGYVSDFQEVQARAKSVDSVTEKIYRNGYGSPATQLTDIIGVRVLTLYETSVKAAVDRLKAKFQTDPTHSVDKTAQLRQRQVGYRSNHLFIRCSAEPAAGGHLLSSTWVEVQIRTVVSHAWAEIEHSLRYKIGDGLPQDISRRFDALAGALELVDREFSSIQVALVDNVRKLAQRYSEGEHLDDKLSALQLLGALALKGATESALGPSGLMLPTEDAFRLSKGLTQVGITDVRGFIAAWDEPATWGVLRRYGELTMPQVEPDKASAIVVVGAIIGNRDRAQFDRTRLFTMDPALGDALLIP